jgi:demethylspheroidene O-methyltransferase
MRALREPTSLARRTPTVNSSASWRDRLLSWRDRLLANRSFQRWAVAFPLTRKIANRRAQNLFDLCAGFVYSQILLACVQLRLFDILAERPQTILELSRRLSLPQKATARLLNAAAALKLAEHRSGDRYGLGALGAALVGNPAIAAMVQHHGSLYADLRDPVSLLRGKAPDTALSEFWPYALAEQPQDLRADDVARYSALMSASQTFIADDVLDAWPMRRHRWLLDVGGGQGTFLMAAAARAPDLRLSLYDLPAVADLARSEIAAAGISDRTTIASGNFFQDPLPVGPDIITLIRVLHDHDDANAVALLHNARRALPDDGILLIAEPMPGLAETDVIGDAYFGFYLLAMGSGRARSAQELGHLLRETGFDGGRVLPTRRPMLVRVVVARPTSTGNGA